MTVLNLNTGKITINGKTIEEIVAEAIESDVKKD